MNSEPATRHQSPATHSDEVLVRVEGVSKKFCRSLKKSLWYGVCDIGAELNPFRRRVAEVAGSGLLVAGNSSNPESSELATSYSPPVTGEAGLRPGEFWAVNDVSFELRRGECLGLIGHNGAGKTTLLKMLNGLIKPDAGKITMRGRVGALIALGAGFNPILTGRENIYINGSVLGLSKKEIDGKIDEIIDFAEIGEFIDSPVQNYSSGMSVRLGFAVAGTLEPDVLIIDEVLAVGDTAFKVKCYNKIRDLLKNTAVVFVSHAMFDINRVCSRVLVMDKGREFFHGSVQEGVRTYNGLNTRGSQNDGSAPVIHLSADVKAAAVSSFESGSSDLNSWLKLELEIECEKPVDDVRVRLVFHDDAVGEAAVAEWDSLSKGLTYSLRERHNILRVEARGIRLRSGNYRVIPVVADLRAAGYHVLIEQGLTMEISNAVLVGAPYRV
jgi:lipopolysaccharide transport system ATP-binding protein